MSTFLFVVFPYVAVILAAGVGLYRYRTNRFSDLSVSSQLRENTKLFWGSVPWHYAIAPILLAHVFAWLFPGLTGSILGFGPRLFAFEVAGLALTLLTALGIVILLARRRPGRSAHGSGPGAVRSLGLALVPGHGGSVALVAGEIAPRCRNGRLASCADSVPFSPFLLGFGVILLFPFTRLLPVVTLPIRYFGRPYKRAIGL